MKPISFIGLQLLFPVNHKTLKIYTFQYNITLIVFLLILSLQSIYNITH